MKKIFFLSLLFYLLPCSLWGVTNNVQTTFVASPTATYDYFDETFETTGGDETWTEGSGTADFNNTTSPIAGSNSCVLSTVAAVGTANSLTAPTSESVTEGYFSVAFQVSDVNSTATTDRFFSLLDSSDNVIAEFRLFSSMTQIYTYYSNNSSVSTGASESYNMAGGATVYLGIYYKAGSGSAEYKFWVSSTALGSSWGTADQTYSSKTSTAGIAKVKSYRTASGSNYYKYDNITGASTEVAR